MEARLREFFYRAVRWYLAVGLRLFFNKIEITGKENLPKDKPFFLAPSHQNAFLDPILAGLLIPTLHCHYLTRSDIFTKKTRYFLETFKMMSIYRMKDGIDQLDKNQEVFDNCAKLFQNNKPILVFPEGNHGENYYLRPLKKGTARMAFYAQEKMKEDLMIVPCGLNYFSHNTPRTKLLIVYGEPISVNNYLPGYKENNPTGLRTITQDLAAAMKTCLVIPEKTNDYEIKVKKVFNHENEVLSFKKLRELASRDYSDDDTQFVDVPKTNFQKNMIVLSSIPNFGPLYLLKKVLEKFKDKVFYASVKYVIMVFAMPIWWIMGFLLGYFLFGVAEGVIMIALSILGLFVRAEFRKA